MCMCACVVYVCTINMSISGTIESVVWCVFGTGGTVVSISFGGSLN